MISKYSWSAGGLQLKYVSQKNSLTMADGGIAVFATAVCRNL